MWPATSLLSALALSYYVLIHDLPTHPFILHSSIILHSLMYYPSIHSSSCPLSIPHLSTYAHIRPPILFYVNHRNKIPEPWWLNQDIYFYTSGNVSQGANEVSGEGSRLLLHMAVSIWPFFCLYVERKIPGVCFCFYKDTMTYWIQHCDIT